MSDSHVDIFGVKSFEDVVTMYGHQISFSHALMNDKFNLIMKQ